jgi:hypothetical protein
MTPKQEAAIRRHGEQLNAIFHTGLDPVTLCKKLRRIEGAATRITTDLCNGTIDQDKAEVLLSKIESRLVSVIGTILPYKLRENNERAIFINRDPRGYALKIDDEYMRAHNLKLHTDWGGYGILAPEFNAKGE